MGPKKVTPYQWRRPLNWPDGACLGHAGPVICSLMGTDAKKVIEAALQLPADDRAEVAARILRSLDEEEGDTLDHEDRARLHEALAASEADFAAGNYRDADEVLADLRQRRR